MSHGPITRRNFLRSSAAAAAAGMTAGFPISAAEVRDAAAAADVTKARSYNPAMEYRRLGKTNLMVSVISMGGHWKKIPHAYGTEEFMKNRQEVIYAAMDRGINFVDACTEQEVATYPKALGKRREEIYFSYSWDNREVRFRNWAESTEKLKEGFAKGLKEVGLEYVDLWRIMMHEQTRRNNTEKEIENAMEALLWAKKEGLARFTGTSSHDRDWIAEAVAKYPQLEVVCTPYTAASKKKPVGSMFDALKQYDVGFIGIKPFASGSVFKSRGMPDSATKAADDERARMVLRYVLSCDVLTAAIPGLITVGQVNTACQAVAERRQFDLVEAAEYEEITREMWANLPPDYQWLRNWEWV